ncbi:carbon-nitrogen hydrolase family protein [Paenibacillus solisilvae]|uniref:Carbon-nitrogen hydrolase family protein n=1 Tax=Paenibacillus solisilvae TaxID=2486751 RepID=A0ABW0W6G3_9BACL
MTVYRTNLIPNSNFADGDEGQVPKHWKVKGPRQALIPNFGLVMEDDRNILLTSGNGNENCIGCIYARFTLNGGKTYHMKVQFQVSDDVNPHKNMLFTFYSDQGFNNGIFDFKRMEDGWIEGDNRFFVPDDGEVVGEVSICFRLSRSGKAWIRQVSFEECEPILPRNVSVACVEGTAPLEVWGQVMDLAGSQKVDLILLPEMFNSSDYKQDESLDGPAVMLMSQKAKQYGMHVAGTFYHMDVSADSLYNTGLLFGRQGEIIGRYDKNHLFSPELLEGGVRPGSDIPVFETDFGKVGMMICYDSWFTDVAELLALKGAEIILFPNAGYYQSLMPARASDNCIRIVASSLGSPLGIWDTSGAEVRSPDADLTRHANCDTTFSDVHQDEFSGIKILFATLDLSQSPSPHNWGGPMKSAPGGRRNRREQKDLLLDEIKTHINNW